MHPNGQVTVMRGQRDQALWDWDTVVHECTCEIFHWFNSKQKEGAGNTLSDSESGIFPGNSGFGRWGFHSTCFNHVLWLNWCSWTRYNYRELQAVHLAVWGFPWSLQLWFFVFNHLEDRSVHTSALLQHMTILSFWARNCREKKGKRRRQNSEETVERLDWERRPTN